MATREQIVADMEKTGVVAIIRANDSSQLIDVVSALKSGGLTCIEVTMTTPDAIGVIAEAAKKFAGTCHIGVGTVLDPETARAAILAGAEFVVSPTINYDVIQLCRRYSKAVLPGSVHPHGDPQCLAGRGGRGEGLPRHETGPAIHQGRQGSAAAGQTYAHRRRQCRYRG